MVVLPVIMITGVTLIGRFAPNSQWSRKYSNSNTQAMLNRRLITEWILAMLALSMGYLCNGVITDVVKNAYGRPRPDFLSRCFGPKDLYVDEDKKFWIALPTKYVYNKILFRNSVLTVSEKPGKTQGKCTFA